MNRNLIVIIAAALTAALQGSALRSEEATPSQKTVSGTIVLVQRDTNQFVLKTQEGKELILGMDARTRIRALNGETSPAIAEGKPAAVTYAPTASQNQVISIFVEGARRAEVENRTAEELAKPSVEAISVAGTIEKVKPDLTELTIKTFDGTEVGFLIEERLRYRFKNNGLNLPDLSKGTEVRAVYVIEDGKNKLLVIRSAVPPKQEPA